MSCKCWHPCAKHLRDLAGEQTACGSPQFEAHDVVTDCVASVGRSGTRMAVRELANLQSKFIYANIKLTFRCKNFNVFASMSSDGL